MVSTVMVTASGLEVLPATSVAVTSICTEPSLTAGLTSQDQSPLLSATAVQTSTPPMVTLIAAPASEVPETVGVLLLVKSSLTGAVMLTSGAWVSKPPGTVAESDSLPAGSVCVAVMSSPSTKLPVRVHDHEPSGCTMALQDAPPGVDTLTVAPGSPVPVMG